MKTRTRSFDPVLDNINLSRFYCRALPAFLAKWNEGNEGNDVFYKTLYIPYTQLYILLYSALFEIFLNSLFHLFHLFHLA